LNPFEQLLTRHLRSILAPVVITAAACSGGGKDDGSEEEMCAEVTTKSSEEGELSRENGYLKLPLGEACPSDPPIEQLEAADCCPVMAPEASCGLTDEQTTTVQPYYGGYTDDTAVESFVVCTYDAVFRAGNACCGRPLTVEGQPLTASARRGPSDWCEPAAPVAAPSEARARAIAYWREVAAMEHASVASFGRVALELLRHGAPADLVARCHEAALDEVRHAQLANGLVAAMTGAPEGPGALPLPPMLPLATDLADIAAAVVREGCIGETLASVEAAARLRHARGAAADVLATIVDDEARHAALAWATLRWLLAVGGDEVRERAAAAFAEGIDTHPALARVPEGGAALGLLDDLARQQALADGWRTVVLPAWQALSRPADPPHEVAEA